VKLDVRNWSETFHSDVREVARGAEHRLPDDCYDLAIALRVVRRMETSAGRGAVFDEIKKKNLLYRLVDMFYSNAGTNIVQPLLLFVYMLKCAISLGPFNDDEGAEAVAIFNFDNERHTVDRVAALVPDVRLLRLSIKRRHMLNRRQIAAALRMIGSARRIWSFLTLLVRLHSFMPSARIASALAFYMRFSHFFAGRPLLRAAVVASNYSPEAVGMAAAAHQAGRRVIYANHAPVPANGAVVPPVLADCALFYGSATRQTYERRSRCTAEIALIGQPGTARLMEWRAEIRTVGIFLTAGTRTEVVASLVSQIRASWPGVKILIRNHPVGLLKTDLSEICGDGVNIEVTIGQPLDDEIAACDLIMCGNSGVALNALSGGRPVAYLADLDRVKFDANGFVASGLVCHVSGWSDHMYNQLRSFYQAPEWQGVMRTYDASYGADVARLEKAATETLLRYIRPRSVGRLRPDRSSTPCPNAPAGPMTSSGPITSASMRGRGLGRSITRGLHW
jgi:hypothetical protein